jgi:hypothetical protein
MTGAEAAARAREILDWLDANPGLSRALAARGIEIELRNAWKEAMSYRLDDADLALIEVNHPTPLVQNLIEEIRRLRDENAGLQVEADSIGEWKDRAYTAEEEIEALESELSRYREAAQ